MLNFEPRRTKPVSTDEQARRHLIEHHLQHIERHTKELRRILQEQS